MTKKTKKAVKNVLPASGYSFTVGIEKTLLRVALVAGPILLAILPETWQNVTLGGALVFLINLAKNWDLEKNKA